MKLSDWSEERQSLFKEKTKLVSRFSLNQSLIDHDDDPEAPLFKPKLASNFTFGDLEGPALFAAPAKGERSQGLQNEIQSLKHQLE